MDGETLVLLDTSVLLNFAAIDRIDLLGSLTNYRFLITDHVREEVLEHFVGQFEAVNAAVDGGILRERPTNSAEELFDFAELVKLGNLGEGECSAIAAAKKLAIPLAMDDKSARKKAVQFHSSIKLLSTVDLMVVIIEAGVLTVASADEIKANWELNHRFSLKFGSFSEKLP